MTNALLRVEAINLENIIDDTDDLPTRRGGGLSLLYAAFDVSLLVPEPHRLSSGASTALLEIEPTKRPNLRDIAATLTKVPRQHATIASVAVTHSPGDTFATLEAKTLAALRWKQLQSPSVVVPACNANNINPVCEVDGVRPQVRPSGKGEATQRVSVAVDDRRNSGRDLRTEFYADQLGDGVGRNFTDDLQALSSDDNFPESNHTRFSPGNLRDKIAVIYADGNHFGHISRAAESGDELRAWDTFIKDKRKALLRALIASTQNDPRWHATTDKSGHDIRLETLLWGGDEFMIAVPAWLGWSTIEFIFNHTEDWCYPPESDGSKRKALTHAVGLVFCHAKAPIRRITKLAHDLAEYGKQKDRTVNSVVWTALESFDHLGINLGDAIAKKYQQQLNWHDWVLSNRQVDELQNTLRQIKHLLPRGQIVAGAQASVFQEPKTESDKRLAHAYARLSDALSPAQRTALSTLWMQLSGEPYPSGESLTSLFRSRAQTLAWVQLSELWDYIGLDALSSHVTWGAKP